MEYKFINSSDQLFDDCPVCQAMKAAMMEERQLSEAELKAAMLKAKEQGGIVGGEWIDKNTNRTPPKSCAVADPSWISAGAVGCGLVDAEEQVDVVPDAGSLIALDDETRACSDHGEE